MISRYGLIVPVSQELKKNLTVRPDKQQDYPQALPFKVFRKIGEKMCIPRFYGEEIEEDKRSDPSCANIEFRGALRTATKQPEAYESAVKSLETCGGGILSLYCGAGKTATSLAVASYFRVRTMILVHKEFLADQWIENIKRFSPNSTIGRVQGDVIDIDADFVVCMIQTLSQRVFEFNVFDSVGLLIVDECHHICARVFSQCMFKLCPKMVLGLSATPNRRDGLTRVLHWFLGPVCFELKREAHGVQVVPVHYKSTLIGVSLSENITNLTKDEVRNLLILETVRSIENTRNILILTDRREHVLHLAESLGDTGVYMGGTITGEDQRILVGTFSLAQEGLDIPRLDTVVFATPKSDIIQAAGRILRGGSKHRPIVYDIVDSGLYGMFKKRCSQYNEMKFSIVTSRDEKESDYEDEYKVYRF